MQYTQTPINGITPGYINQMIVKLAFWELGLCKNYMCLDSDGWFIKEFYVKDFMYDSEIPYTVLYEDKDLKCNPYYYNSFWEGREKQIKIIQNKLNYKTNHLLTCHGFQIFNSAVLQSLKSEYMVPNKLTYLNLITVANYEFSWYNIWLQKTQIIPIHICEPFFKTYHMAYQQFEEVFSGVTEETLKNAYIGITLCNYERTARIISVNDIDKIIYAPKTDQLLKLLQVIIKYIHVKMKRKLWNIYSMLKSFK